ncbi:MAG TPA: hypothetical protein VN958_08720, partial [Chitinophagaceae bacterium]|nr:hypothetical protein [Chitinophagaceae bacterium]
MDPVTENVHRLFTNWYGNDYEQITQLQQSGSDRIYFRIYAGNESYIATYNLNVKENKTFIAFSQHFKSLGLPVPEIYAVNDNYTAYIQQDLGTESLLNQLEKYGYTDLVYNLFSKSLQQLAYMQING